MGTIQQGELLSWQLPDIDWLRNHVKVVGEREILASLGAVKLHSIADMKRKENEKRKKQKLRRPL